VPLRSAGRICWQRRKFMICNVQGLLCRDASVSENPVDEDGELTPGPGAGADECRKWLQLFVKEHHGRLVHALCGILGTVEEGKEVAQEAYVQILQHRGVKTPRHMRHLIFR